MTETTLYHTSRFFEDAHSWAAHMESLGFSVEPVRSESPFGVTTYYSSAVATSDKADLISSRMDRWAVAVKFFDVAEKENGKPRGFYASAASRWSEFDYAGYTLEEYLEREHRREQSFLSTHG